MVSEWYLTEWYSEWSNGILNGTYKNLFSFFVNDILNGIPLLHIIPSTIQNTIDKYHSKDKLINIYLALQRSYAHIDQTENIVKIN